MTNPSQDILTRLADLHKQATIERSHFYVGAVVIDAIGEIIKLQFENQVMRNDLKEVRCRVPTKPLEFYDE